MRAVQLTGGVVTLELSPFCPKSPIFLYASLEKCKYVSLTGRIVKFGIYINRLVEGGFILVHLKAQQKAFWIFCLCLCLFLGKNKSVAQRTPNTLQSARKRSGSETFEGEGARERVQRRRHAKDKSAMDQTYIN